jgi:hypothetical protein
MTAGQTQAPAPAPDELVFQALQQIAPGKYRRLPIWERVKCRARHLKGGGHVAGPHKDYNLSVFRFPDGVTEIKCLYNCGLKVRSNEPGRREEFEELMDLMERSSSNSRASSEVCGKRNPPGPVPVYSDAYRQRIKESTDVFLKTIQQGVESGRIKLDDPILGTVRPHPDPVEAPESEVERGIVNAFARTKVKAVKNSIKAKKARKTKSRRRAG